MTRTPATLEENQFDVATGVTLRQEHLSDRDTYVILDILKTVFQENSRRGSFGEDICVEGG